MQGPYGKIEQDLAKLLDQKLLGDIYAFREKRLSRIAEIVQNMLNALNETTGVGTIAQGLEQLRDFTKTEAHDAIHDQLITDIFVLKDELPKRMVYHQTDEHFKVYQDDTIYVKAGKMGKQLMRKLGKSEWMQKIPLQNVIAYHLLDADWFFQDWLAAEERLLMQIVLELDQVLAHATKADVEKSNKTELQQLLKVVKNEIDEAKRSHRKKLREARNTLIKELISVVSTVGTIERRTGFYDDNRLMRKRDEIRTELDEYQENWHAINSQLLDRTMVLQQFIMFCENLEAATETFKADIDRIFNRVFSSPYNRLENQIGSVRQQVAHSEQQLSTVLIDNNHSLSHAIQEQLLEPLNATVKEDEIQQRVDEYASRLKQQCDALAETAVFITEINRGYDPPKVKSKKIKWQALVSRRLNGKLVNKFIPDDDNIEKFISRQLHEAEEIEEIVEVNLESALDLSREQSPGDDPYSVVDEALQRALSKIEKSDAEARKTRHTLLEPMDEGLAEFQRSMFELLHDGDIDNLQVLDARFKVSEKTHGWRASGKTRWQSLWHRTRVLSRFLRRKIKQSYRKSSTWFGYRKTDSGETKQVDIAAYLSKNEQKISELPFIYRRLFNFEAKAEQRYYVGWNENKGTMQAALDHWKNGFSSTLAVLGEKGSGKSTYLDLIESQAIALERVIRINLQETIWTGDELIALFNDHFEDHQVSSVDELVSYLKKKRENTVIIFEGVQNLYLRHLNGYEAIEQFIYLIAETSDKIFWMISCSQYAWNFLDVTFSVGDYFSHYVKTDALSEQQIKKVIMNRHQASGYDLVFTPSETEAKTRSYRRLVSDKAGGQEYLKDKYFAELAELAEGNASIAMIFWIRSIQKFDDTNCYIAPLEAASLEMLEELTPKTLFILASLVLHDALHPDELSLVQNTTVQESSMVLRRLKGKGVVLDSDYGLSLNHLIYRQVIRALKELNILHLNP